jgi:hypothetical protein
MTNYISKLSALALLCFLITLIPTESIAKEQISTSFDNAFLNLPYPDDYCILGGTPSEDKILEWQTFGQLKADNKVLAMWISCKDKQKIQSGKFMGRLEKWVIINGILSNGTEKAYPNYDPEDYKELMAGEFDQNTIQKEAGRAIANANKKYLDDKDAVSISWQTDLGVLSFTDSVHKGLVMKASAGSDSEIIAGVTSFILINGIPLGFHFYSTYDNKKTITKLLSEAEIYSAELVYSN